MFTVLIPAFNRPELLRTALVSVSQQTAKHDIDAVIVSENGLNRGSEEVCKEFPDLPIKYCFQKQQLHISKHMQWLLSQVENGYGAMLCDDDWWDVHHLSLAKEALLANPQCVSYFSNYTLVSDTFSMRGSPNYWGKAMHYGKSDFSNFKLNIYNLQDVVLLCLLFTPFHFSSIVCKGDILRSSTSIFDEVHPTFADRLLYPIIASYGSVAYNPLATAIILLHPGQDSHTYDSDEWQIERQNGSLKLLEVASRYKVDVKNYMNSVYLKANPIDASFMSQELSANFCDTDKLNWFAGYKSLVEEKRIEKVKKEKQIEYNSSIKGKIVRVAKRYLQ